MNFRVGQKVVCVDDTWVNPYWIKNTPNKPLLGAVYTIRCIRAGRRGCSVLIEEISNPLHSSGIELGFYARRFRPLVERKTDTGMSILKSILADAENYKVKETV